ncbi:MAG: hypothetical protein OHK0052_26900 [Anaerolineales bacterium]
MKHMRLLVTLFFAAMLLSGCTRNNPGPLTAPADPAALPNITGDYAVNGSDPTGAEYGGTLHIEEDGTGTYQLYWVITGSLQSGSGSIEGNQLLVSWQTYGSATGEIRGTAIYTITQTGQLDGIRLIEGNPTQGVEVAYPNQPPTE